MCNFLNNQNHPKHGKPKCIDDISALRRITTDRHSVLLCTKVGKALLPAQKQ